jgi:hypothetical protein
MNQCLSAAYLFGRYGGIGAKCRKGFGSISISRNKYNKESECIQEAEDFRTKLEVKIVNQLVTCSIQHSVYDSIKMRGDNVWEHLQYLGLHYSHFLGEDPKTGHGKHCPNKIAFGIPRKIHGPNFTPMNNSFKRQNPATHKPPENLSVNVNGKRVTRFTSPVFFHIDRDGGSYYLTVLGFISPFLPDKVTHENLLNKLCKYL